MYPKGRAHADSIVDYANYAKWLLSCALVSKGCENLRDEFGIDMPSEYIREGDSLCFKSFENLPPEETDGEENAAEFVVGEPDGDFAAELNRRMYYVYPFERLTTVAAKRTASELNEQTVNTDYFASAKPAFMSKGSFTPAQRGTLTHLFMETCDFSEAQENAEQEIERLTALGVFTKEQAAAIDFAKITAFFGSNL